MQTHTCYTFLQAESVVSMIFMYLNYVLLCRTQAKKVVESSLLLKAYLGHFVIGLFRLQLSICCVLRELE